MDSLSIEYICDSQVHLLILIKEILTVVMSDSANMYKGHVVFYDIVYCMQKVFRFQHKLIIMIMKW